MNEKFIETGNRQKSAFARQDTRAAKFCPFLQHLCPYVLFFSHCQIRILQSKPSLTLWESGFTPRIHSGL
jgi:hypothetical protein